MELKKAREAANVTQAELAQRTGILQTNLSLQESGLRDLSFDDMIQCEKALDTLLDWRDTFSAANKVEVLQAMASLMNRYPLVTVLDFAKKTLTDRRDTTPVKKLQFVANQTAEIAPLLPTDVQIEIKAKEKEK